MPEKKAPPFKTGEANTIASEETRQSPPPARKVTLEEADLKNASARDLYKVRVVERVNDTDAPGTGRKYKIFKKDVPNNATTKVGEVADAIVKHAS